MFCSKCGSKNDDNAAFCSSCGEKLNAPQAAKAAKEAPVVTTTATGSVATGDGSTAKAAKRTGSIIGIIVAVAVVAIVVAAIAMSGFGLMGGNSGASGLLSSPAPSVKGSVNDYTWDELSVISTEISDAEDEDAAIEVAKGYNLTTEDGRLDGTQTKSVQLSDGTDVDAQITGFWHDDKTSGGKAGITFIFNDAIAEHDMNSNNTNSGGWEDSQIRSWLASDGMNMMPDDLKSALVEVNKKTNNVGKTESVSSVTTTADKLWLYSLAELAGMVPPSYFPSKGSYEADVFNEEGSQYQLFEDLSISIQSVWLRDAGGLRDDESWPESFLARQSIYGFDSWWMRSPDPTGTSNFCDVPQSSNPVVSAKYSLGVVPGFCI